jgi:hypothetical protein
MLKIYVKWNFVVSLYITDNSIFSVCEKKWLNVLVCCIYKVASSIRCCHMRCVHCCPVHLLFYDPATTAEVTKCLLK